MKISSPLRYPGGKAVMSGLLAQIRKLNGLGDRSIAEPFSGGAGASLSLLFQEATPEIYINDADPAIYGFWWTIVNRPKPFFEMLKNVRINMTEWYRQRNLYRKSANMSMLRRGFAAFYLNRCNRSGIIIDGGPIGGYKQNGKWRLNARFNKSELFCRCEKIFEYRDRINVSCLDGLELIESLDLESTFFFIDPPYYNKGNTLYLNKLDDKYHKKLSYYLKSIKEVAWVLTYDDCPEIRRMYRGWANIKSFSLRYSAAARRQGKEILITPKWINLPKSQKSLSITW